MHFSTPHHHTVFAAGRLSRLVHPVCLAAWPHSRAAAAAARPRLGTAAGVRHTAARSLTRCAARKADGPQKDGSPQHQCQDTAAAAQKPAAPKRTRSSNTPVRDEPWNAATKAAVLQFWTAQGALLPEAEVQPEQQAEQRRLRSRILRWAAKYPQHRDLEVLTDYMAKARDATEASEWADDPWRVALHNEQFILYDRSPASMLQRAQIAKHQLAQHGIFISRAQSLIFGWNCGDATGDKAVKLVLALSRLPFSLDVARVIAWAPLLMGLDDIETVLKRRVAAVQQLHPRLDVARMLNRQPSLLGFTEETLAGKWASLQMASGLGDDDMRAVVQYSPGILTQDVGVIGWRIQQLCAYEVARDPTGAGCTPASGMSRVLAAASFRVWRLCYRSVAGNFQYGAVRWVSMGKEDFAARNPGYSMWLASHPVPPEAYRNSDS